MNTELTVLSLNEAIRRPFQSRRIRRVGRQWTRLLLSLTLLSGGISASARQANLLSLYPASALANGASDILLTVQGNSGFNCVTDQVYWNGTLLTPTLFCDSSNLVVNLPSAFLASTVAIQTAEVDVRNSVTLLISNPLSFTLIDSTVDPDLLQSAIIPFGGSTTLSTVYTVPGSGGVDATYNNNATGGAATLTVANYNVNPAQGTIFSVGGGFYDVQVKDADPTDTLTVFFYYPHIPDGGLSLQYYPNGSILPQTVPAAIQNVNDDQNSTLSGGYFSVTFTDTSIPSILSLSGTVFALAPVPLSATPAILWPPNHKMKTVTVNAPGGTIVAVSSNEPATGTGNGDKGPDWEITGPLTVKLRAERGNSAEGRIYSILLILADGSQNLAVVRVPHDQGNH